MPAPQQRNLVLILAREFASKLATAVFLTDAEGNLVYYNEPAEEILGRRFAEAGRMEATELSALFHVESPEGEPTPLERMPIGVALLERRPAHGELRITGLDGSVRSISATSFPLFARHDEFVGAVSIFWTPDGERE